MVLKINRAPVLPSGYTLAKFQRNRIRNNGDIEAESKWERKKENNKNKKLYKNRKVYRLCRSTLINKLTCILYFELKKSHLVNDRVVMTVSYTLSFALNLFFKGSQWPVIWSEHQVIANAKGVVQS